MDKDLIIVPSWGGGLPRGLTKRSATTIVQPAPKQIVTANENADFSLFVPGDELPDGTIYIGEVDNSQWATTPHRCKRKANYQTALQIVQQMTDHGHNDWLLPDSNVASQLWRVRFEGKLVNTFHDAGFSDYNIVWISGEVNNCAPVQEFSVYGTQKSYDKKIEYSIRPVRRCP